MELLEYLVQIRGGAVAAGEVRGLRTEFQELGAAAAGANREAAASSAGIGRSGAALGAMAKIGKVGALALVATGLEAVRMSNTFQTEMLKIRTEGGASSSEFARMRKGVLDLASSGQSLGAGPTSLAMGLYHLESMGLRGSKALMGLKLAAQEAAISGSSLEDTTTAIGGALFVAMKGTGNLSQMMSTLNAIAGSGNMRFQELNLALGTGLLSSAKNAGLSLQEVGAALAVLTDSGMHASSAGAQLATALHFLFAPTQKATDALASVRMGQFRLAEDLRKPQGLTTALADLHSHLDKLGHIKQEQVLNAIMPGGRGRVLLTLYNMLDRIHNKYLQIRNTAGGITGGMPTRHGMLGAGTVAGLRGAPQGFDLHVAEQQANASTRLRMGWARVQAEMVRLGDVLTKYVTPALIFLEHIAAGLIKLLIGLPGLVKRIVGWFRQHRTITMLLVTAVAMLTAGLLGYRLAVIAATAAQALMAGAGTLMAFLSLVSQVRSLEEAMVLLNLVMDANPIGLVVGAIAALVAGLVLAYTHVKWFRDAVNAAWGWLKGAVVTVVHFVAKHWGLLGGILLGPFAWAVRQIISAWGAVTSFFGSVPKKIVGFFSGLGSSVGSIFVGIGNIVIGALNAVIGAINSVIDSYNSVAGSIPILGGSLTIGHVGTIGALGTTHTVPNQRFGGVTSGRGEHGALHNRRVAHATRQFGHAADVTMTNRPVIHRGDLILKVGSREFGRITRDEIHKAMMA